MLWDARPQDMTPIPAPSRPFPARITHNFRASNRSHERGAVGPPHERSGTWEVAIGGKDKVALAQRSVSAQSRSRMRLAWSLIPLFPATLVPATHTYQARTAARGRAERGHHQRGLSQDCRCHSRRIPRLVHNIEVRRRSLPCSLPCLSSPSPSPSPAVTHGPARVTHTSSQTCTQDGKEEAEEGRARHRGPVP